MVLKSPINRENIFGEIIVGADGCPPNNTNVIINLNVNGLIVDEELKHSEMIRNEITLDEYIIMPNHLHAIITINRDVSGGQPYLTGQRPLAPTDHHFNRKQTLRSLNTIRKYIVYNPINWEQDIDNLINL